MVHNHILTILYQQGGITPKMLGFIKEKGFITDRDYAKLVNRAKATRALDFKKLIELGLISRKGKGKLTYYILKEK